jgi:hypothetical protein
MDSWSTRDLQTVLALISAHGGDLETLLLMLRAEIDRRTFQKRATAPPASHDYGPCPALGCEGRLVFWPHSSRQVGMIVIGCVRCHFSRMEP